MSPRHTVFAKAQFLRPAEVTIGAIPERGGGVIALV